ncbi:hypothetical protein PAHAL_2G030900 [Panicum hallii]|uniref:Uncharacterized protein n=1 Tax=Panicum hallii TaxID=206008 RepID=A0A2T8KMP7_9POAL|nr:hypothetical protein PAHAL_2G030900 [Panicum hallii]
MFLPCACCRQSSVCTPVLQFELLKSEHPVQKSFIFDSSRRKLPTSGIEFASSILIRAQPTSQVGFVRNIIPIPQMDFVRMSLGNML